MILFLDTASSYRIVSVFDGTKEIITKLEKNDIDLSSKMLPLIESTLNEASIKPSQIDKIMVVTGPGSFTGIRIGVTIAKTWAWTLKKKIIPISELELLSTTPFDGDYIVPYIDARRDYGYAGVYNQEGNLVIEDSHIKRETLLEKLPKNKKIVFVTDDQIEVPYPIVEPSIKISKIIAKHIDDEGVNPHECNPNYLKKTEAEENLEKGNLHDPLRD